MSLADRLRNALETGHGIDTVLLTGDHRDLELDQSAPLMNAAVLVAVTDRPEPGVILTPAHRYACRAIRPGRLSRGADRLRATAAPIAAALREAEEEIALPRDRVTVIGEADRYRTVTGFDVTPVIGIVPPDLILIPSAAEVAQVFEVPLDFVLDSANHVEATVEWQGRNRHYYEINWDGHRIWGATAAMIVNLSRRLRWNG